MDSRKPYLTHQASRSGADRCTYGSPWSGEGFRALLVSQIAMIKSYKTQRGGLVKRPPPGFDSVIAIPGVDFSYEEVAVYNATSIRPAYVILYGTPVTPTPLKPPKVPVKCIGRREMLTPFLAQKTLPQVSVHSHHNSSQSTSTVTELAKDIPSLQEATKPISSTVTQRIMNLIRINNSRHSMSRVVLRARAVDKALSLPEGAVSLDLLRGEDIQQFLDLLQEVRSYSDHR